MRKGGPSTPRGKATVARNAIRHAVCATAPVIPGLERPEDWEAHRAGIRASLQPVGPLETELAERVALLLWRLRRVARFETAAILADEEDHQEFQRLLAAIPTYGHHLRAHLSPQEACAAVETLRAGLQALEALATLPPDTPLAAVDLRPCPDTPSFQELRAQQEAPDSTVGTARAALAHNPPGARLADLLQHARDALAAAEDDAARALAHHERVRSEHLLPAPSALDRVVRYEAHLSRQLVATMHELEALQARRDGQPIPLARLAVSGLASK